MSEVKCYFCAAPCSDKYWVKRTIKNLTIMVAVCKKCLDKGDEQ